VVDVHGEWLTASDEPASGRYVAFLPVRLQDSAGNVIYPAGLIASGPLVDGEFTISVPASDDPALSPQGWQLQIDVVFRGAGTERYRIPVPSGSTIELADVVLPYTLGDPAPVLIRGVPGGIAELDEDGLVPVGQLPTGLGGLAAIMFTQASPLGSWTITHSLGRLPLIHVYVGGSEVLADIDADATTATVTFASPASGVAVLA
jgi:hypothetical protein